MHPNAEHVAAMLRALGVEVGAIANSLIFRSSEPVLILASGAHRVDMAKAAVLLDLPSLERADADYVRAATGQPIGGVAPVGHPRQLRTAVDITLAAYPVVWCGAGPPQSVFDTTYDELLRLTGGRAIEVI